LNLLPDWDLKIVSHRTRLLPGGAVALLIGRRGSVEDRGRVFLFITADHVTLTGDSPVGWTWWRQTCWTVLHCSADHVVTETAFTFVHQLGPWEGGETQEEELASPSSSTT